jgi:NTE family protein
VAFVLSGGGNLGALQVGMLRALAERGIRPDVVLGCSVGALNGAAYAADPTVAGVRRLEDLWLTLAGPDVMPAAGWLPSTLQLARKGEALHDNAGLREVVERILRPTTFEELRVPFQCVATQLDPPDEVWFGAGPLHDAILASAALPAVFPIVELDGHQYIDGGIANDIPISRALELGARRAYVLHVGTLDRPWLEPRRPVDVAIQAHWLSRRLRFDRDLEELGGRIDLEMLPYGDPPRPRYDDFSHTPELITQAYAATAAHLDALAGVPAEEEPTMPLEADFPRVTADE